MENKPDFIAYPNCEKLILKQRCPSCGSIAIWEQRQKREIDRELFYDQSKKQLCSQCGRGTGWRVKNGQPPVGFYPLCEQCAELEKQNIRDEIARN